MTALRLVVRWGLVLAAVLWTAWQLPALVGSASAGVGVLAELSVERVVVACLLGVAAVAAYAELHRELLTVGGARPSAAAVQSITFAQNAIANTVPVVGGAGALAYAVGSLRRRGVDAALATWTVLAAGALSTFCLAVLAIGALVATGALSLPAAALLLAGVAAAVAAAGALLCHPGVLRSAVVRLLVLRRHLPRSGAAGGAAGAAAAWRAADGALGRLLLLMPSASQWLRLLALSVVTWLLDFATLAVTAAAVPGTLRWSALVQGFLVVQASIALQILPGGAGLAELGLLGSLLGSGVAAGPAAVVVLIYRSSSWFLPSLLGWVSYGAQLTPLGGNPAKGCVPDADNHPVAVRGRERGDAVLRPVPLPRTDAPQVDDVEDLGAVGAGERHGSHPGEARGRPSMRARPPTRQASGWADRRRREGRPTVSTSPPVVRRIVERGFAPVTTTGVRADESEARPCASRTAELTANQRESDLLLARAQECA